MTHTTHARRVAVALLTGLAVVPQAALTAGQAPRQTDLVARSSLPLYGKTILYTAPRNYAGRLGQLLIERGARPIWMPTITIEPVADYREFDEVIREREKYRWIAFTSRNGIDAYLNRIEALGLKPADVVGLKTAAIGNDAALLEQSGLKPALMPPVPSPTGIVEELERRGETQGVVIVPAPDVVGMAEPAVVPDFVRDLERIGLKTRRVPAYVTARETKHLEIGTRLLLAGEIDIVAFTSRGEIDSLLLHLGNRRDALSSKIAVACFGPITSEGARLQNLTVDIVSEQYSRFEGFVSAMEKWALAQPRAP
ncbi:MAG: uroporphyrinogen-III synthase [Gammaproteobacteria bacterium]|nr:uroporphyrinogen-III synthase [Gammaproteobacteria bacterium]